MPSVFHSDFDNFDQFVNDLSGAGSMHTANGIMLQDFEEIDSPSKAGGDVPVIPRTERTKERCLDFGFVSDLPDYYVTKRKGPSFIIVRWTDPEWKRSVLMSSGPNMVWLLIRLMSSRTEQEVPGWEGFLSMTGEKPKCLTTIDYYPVINHSITEYKTVQEVLRYSEEGTREVGQEYTITTFDLGVCMKAYLIVWNNPYRYSKHIIPLGTFHLVIAYFKMAGKKMAASGLEDILLEAGLMSCGSIKGVMSGKSYGRSVHCHKILLECIERLLFEQFMLSRNEDTVCSSLPAASKALL